MAEEDDVWWMFKAKQPRFCTIILDDDTFRSGKLMIPEEFATEHGVQLPNRVVLKLPTGSEWQVRLLRRGPNIWLDKGWREFAQFNSLAPGHLLVFEYGSRGHFRVLIFDMTSTEIKYRTQEANRVVEPECEVIDVSDDDSLHGHSHSLNTRENPPLRSTRALKLRRRDEKGIFVSNCETTVCHGSSSMMAKQRKRTMTSVRCSSPKWVVNQKNEAKPKKSPISRGDIVHGGNLCFQIYGRSPGDNQARKRNHWPFQREKSLTDVYKVNHVQKESLTAVEEARVLARATASFKSENPFFMLAMQPSYVGTVISLNLPADFFRRHLNCHRGDIILRVPDGRVWTVEYRVIECSSREKAIFGHNSWTRFARENSLKVGDVCAFELVKGDSDEPILNVVIFRATQDLPNRYSSPQRVLNPTIKAKHKKSTFSRGKTVFGSTSGKRRKHWNESPGAWEAAKAFSSDRPFFTVSVKPFHLSMGQMVRFFSSPHSFIHHRSMHPTPLAFLEHISSPVQPIPQPFGSGIMEVYYEAELWVAGKCWRVRIRKYWKETRCMRKYLGSGWGKFAVENSVKVGDVCVYELVMSEISDDDDDGGRRMMVLNAHIFRG